MNREACLGDLYTLAQMPPLYDRFIWPGGVVSFHPSFFYGAYGISPSYSSSTRVAVLEDLYCDYWLMPSSWWWHPTALAPDSNEFPIV